MNNKKKLMTGIALGASAVALLIGSTGVAQAHSSNHGGGLPSSLVTKICKLTHAAYIASSLRPHTLGASG